MNKEYVDGKALIEKMYQLGDERLREKIFYGGVESAQNILLTLCERSFSNVSVGTLQFCHELYVNVWLRLHGAFLNEDPALARWIRLSNKYITDKNAGKYAEVPYKIVDRIVDESIKIIYELEPELSNAISKEILGMVESQIAQKDENDKNLPAEIKSLIIDLYNSSNIELRDKIYYGNASSASEILTKLCINLFNDYSVNHIKLCNSLYVEIWIRTHGSLSGNETKQPGYIKEMLSRKFDVSNDIIDMAVDISYGIILRHEPELLENYIAGFDEFKERIRNDRNNVKQNQQQEIHDEYVVEFERAIFNRHLEGDDAHLEPVLNSLMLGLENDMQVLVPVEISNSILDSIGNPENLKAGDSIKLKNDIAMKFRYIGINGVDKPFLPVFTSYDEMNKGEHSSSINQSLKVLIENLKSSPDCAGIIVNPWDKKFVLIAPLIEAMATFKKRSHISIIKGNILDLHVGAIVSSANENLNEKGGVNSAIHKAAGKELLMECQRLNGCHPGEAKITKSYNIVNADYIIHTVGPTQSGSDEDDETLASCYVNSLELAIKNNCFSIAFPSISTGMGNFSISDAAEISYVTTLKWLIAHPNAVINVYFSCYRNDEYEAYNKIIKMLTELSKGNL